MESGESLDYVHHFLLTVKPRINQGEDKKDEKTQPHQGVHAAQKHS